MYTKQITTIELHPQVGMLKKGLLQKNKLTTVFYKKQRNK